MAYTLHGKTASSKEFPECLLAKWAAVELEDIKPMCTYGDYNLHHQHLVSSMLVVGQTNKPKCIISVVQKTESLYLSVTKLLIMTLLCIKAH